MEIFSIYLSFCPSPSQERRTQVWKIDQPTLLLLRSEVWLPKQTNLPVHSPGLGLGKQEDTFLFIRLTVTATFTPAWDIDKAAVSLFRNGCSFLGQDLTFSQHHQLIKLEVNCKDWSTRQKTPPINFWDMMGTDAKKRVPPQRDNFFA